MNKKSRISLLLTSILSLTSFASADNWPQWRGPAFNGSTAETNLPEKLDPAANLAFKIDLPGQGAATPVVWADKLFTTCWDKQSGQLVALCYSTADGKLLWQRDIATSTRNTGGQRGDMAGPSPITDGKTVFFYFGTGDLAAFDLDGNQLWKRSITKDHGPFNVLWLYASSPLLYKGKLYIQVLHRDGPANGLDARKPGQPASESYLLAIDPSNGKDLWKVTRPNDAAVESKESYATPIPFEGKDRTEILLIGGDCATGHDAQTGKELWRVGRWNPFHIVHWRLVPSMTVADSTLIACVPKGGPVIAIKPGGNGEVTLTHIAWQSSKISSDVCVPLFYQGTLYVLDGDKKAISSVDAKTGDVKWSTKLDSKAVFRASPLGADGKIYCMNETGDVWVVSADGKILSKVSLAEGSPLASRASIIAADGKVIVRAADKMYAFRK